MLVQHPLHDPKGDKVVKKINILATTYMQNIKLTLRSNGSLFVAWGAQYLLAN